jgi:fatty-acyl-CoA synthase
MNHDPNDRLYRHSARELAPELNHCAPGALKAGLLPHLSIAIHFADTDEPGYHRFSDIRGIGGPAERERLEKLSGLLQSDDPINIQFTSGTTGTPKAAMLTHHGLLNNGYFFGLMKGVKAGDRHGMPMPLYHVGGMVLGSILGITLGVTIVYLGEAFDPLASLETIQAERCTDFGVVPTMLIEILNHPAFHRFNLGSLRGGCAGGSPVPSDILRRAMDDMNMRDMVCVYGMTELSGSSVQNTIGDSFQQRTRTVGRVQPHMEVKIADPEGRAGMVRGVAVSRMRMMGRLMMITLIVVFCGLAMMVGGFLVVFSRGAMMFGALIDRHDGLFFGIL